MSTQASVTVERPSVQDSTSSPPLLFVWPVIVLLIGLSLWMLQPPEPVPTSAPPQDFSAARAMADVQIIARIPHPIGSAANAAVRDYLVTRLTALNMAPQVFSGIGVSAYGGSVAAGKVENVVGRMDGRDHARAILLVAHYDSVDRAPGAGDDGAGVAALLETVRALKAGPQLRNDVIVLFTDGEEEGLLGAEMFAHSHPWMKQAGLVMNFEGRGNKDVSLLFETSAANRTLLQETASVSPQPFASSLFYSIYKLLPNDTDFTILRRSQVPGMNFAFGGGLEAYHTALDTPEHVSAASIQNHGAYALAFTRHFGDMDLAQLDHSTGDAVFFNSLGNHLVVYPESWVIPQEILLTVFLLAALAMNARSKRVTIARVLLASATWIVILLVVPAVLAGAWWVLSFVLGSRLIRGDAPSNALLLTGLLLLAALVLVYLFRLGRNAIGARNFCFGGLVTVSALSWVLALKMPAGSYLLVVPLLLVAMGLLLAGIFAKSNRLTEPIATAPAAIAMILLYAPLMYLVYVFLTLQMITAAAAGFLVALFFAVGAPLLDVSVPTGKPLRWMSGSLAALMLVSIVAGIILSRASAVHPRFDTIFYSVNSDEHAAAWLSYDQALDSWTSHFFPEAQRRRQAMPDYIGGSTRSVWSTPATLVELAPPEVEVKENIRAGEERHLHLIVRSHRDARMVLLRFEKSIRVSAANIGGRELPVHQRANEPFSVSLYGFKQDGIDLDLTVDGAHDLVFWAMDESGGLPVSSERPPDHLAWYGSDVTFVSRKYSLAARASL